MGTTERTVQVVSLFSILCSLAVVIDFLRNSSLRRKLFPAIVLNIALAEMFGNVGSAMGYPENGTTSCWAQGLITGWFYLSSVFWVGAATRILYEIVCLSRRDIPMHFYFAVSWGIPLLVTLLPLSTSDYGRASDQRGHCFIVSRDGTAPWLRQFWIIASFYGWLWIALVLMLYWGAAILRKLRDMKVDDVRLVSRAFDALFAYPVITLLCYIPTSLSRLWIVAGHNDHDFPHFWPYFTQLPVILHGFLTAAVFFTKTSASSRGTSSTQQGTDVPSNQEFIITEKFSGHSMSEHIDYGDYPMRTHSMGHDILDTRAISEVDSVPPPVFSSLHSYE